MLQPSALAREFFGRFDSMSEDDQIVPLSTFQDTLHENISCPPSLSRGINESDTADEQASTGNKRGTEDGVRQIPQVRYMPYMPLTG